MSRVLQKIDEYQQELKNRIPEENPTIPVSYAMMQASGLLKATTFRLPVHTLAQMDELFKFGPWDSKQEMVFDLVDDVIQQFLQDPGTGEPVREKFRQVAQAALDEWRANREEVAA